MSESTNTPTVVLVHGGFADASLLGVGHRGSPGTQCAGARAAEPAAGSGPRRRVRRELCQPDRWAVLLVGHSYGGAVISVAGASAPNAVGLVYVAAFALDEGESFGEIFGEFGDTPLVGAVRPSNYPLADGETAVELTIAPEKALLREGFRRRPVGRCHQGLGRQPASLRRDLRPPRRPPGRHCRPGRSSRPRTTPFPGCRATHGSACRCADDRGRRVALDRALAAERGCRADPHRRRGDIGRAEQRLVDSLDSLLGTWDDGTSMLAPSTDRARLLGRSAELEVLTGLLDDVEVSGAALVLRGDPGIGKSRLLSEAIALAEARGMSGVLATRGRSVRGPTRVRGLAAATATSAAASHGTNRDAPGGATRPGHR